MPPPPLASSAKLAHKPRTLQEQIALNKQKKAEDLHKAPETDKAADGHAKPLTWQERARRAREARLEKETAGHAKPGETAEKPAVATEKEATKGGSAPLAMSPTQKRLMAEQAKTAEVPTKPAESAEKPAAATEKEAAAGDEPMKKAANIPAPPKGGPKSLAMSPTQKKLMASQEKSNSADKPAGSADVFAEFLKKRPRVD